jgi:O-antigen/teichoic acid export membrane protein
MKLGIIPGSVLGVMFPELSATLITGSDRFPVLYDQSIRFILFMLAPVTLGIIVLAEPLLTLWLGREFAVHSTLVLQILAVGIYVNSASQVPYTAIQAIGRPDITAKLHILELPFYMVAIVFLIIKMGIIGAALAWLLRVLIDTLLLFRCAHRFIPSLSRQSGRLNTSMTIITGYLILSLCITQFLPGLMFRVFLLIALITVLLTYIWRVSLEPDEKRELMFIVANCGRLVGISTAR